MVGRGTALADLHLPVRVNGDLALFQAIGALLLEWDAVDHDFVEQYTSGFEEYAAHVKRPRLGRRCVAATGLTREQIEECAAMFRDSVAHRDLLGDGADPAPQLGGDHQGDRQRRVPPGQHRQAGRRALPGPRPLQRAGRPDHGHLGAAASRHFLDALRDEFHFEPPREHGFDTVEAIKALRDGRARVFFAMGGNFVSAVSDTDVTEQAMRNAELTVHVSTKLNRSHVVTRPRPR